MVPLRLEGSCWAKKPAHKSSNNPGASRRSRPQDNVIRAFQVQPLSIVRLPSFDVQLAPMRNAPIAAGQQKPRRSLQPSNLTVRAHRPPAVPGSGSRRSIFGTGQPNGAFPNRVALGGSRPGNRRVTVHTFLFTGGSAVQLDLLRARGARAARGARHALVALLRGPVQN